MATTTSCFNTTHLFTRRESVGDTHWIKVVAVDVDGVETEFVAFAPGATRTKSFIGKRASRDVVSDVKSIGRKRRREQIKRRGY